MGIISKLWNFTTGVIDPDKLNANFDALYTLVDGELDGANIAEGAIDADNLNASISPLVRWSETFRNYVVSDLTVINDGLDCSVLPGIAYVSGERVTPAGSGHTVQDETTTYCDLSSDETFSWNSNASPLPGYLRLAKVVSTSGDCTITDMRTFNPLAVWDLESAISVVDAHTTSASMATLLTVTMLDVEEGDSLIMVMNGTFSSTTNPVGAGFQFTVGGVVQSPTEMQDIEVAGKYKIITAINLCSATADAATLVVNFDWQTSAATLNAHQRGLYVLRLRPTR